MNNGVRKERRRHEANGRFGIVIFKKQLQIFPKLGIKLRLKCKKDSLNISLYSYFFHDNCSFVKKCILTIFFGIRGNSVMVTFHKFGLNLPHKWVCKL